eukprot:428679-Prymnesium_polylepis.1
MAASRIERRHGALSNSGSARARATRAAARSGHALPSHSPTPSAPSWLSSRRHATSALCRGQAASSHGAPSSAASKQSFSHPASSPRGGSSASTAGGNARSRSALWLCGKSGGIRTSRSSLAHAPGARGGLCAPSHATSAL